jgi:hypothetical protein
MCVSHRPPSDGFVAQLINRSPLDFDAQTKKPPRWFWGLNHQTRAASLRTKPKNPPPPWFWGSTKKLTAGFEVKAGETVVTSFEVKLEKTVAISFEAKLEKTVTAGFEAKPLEAVTTSFKAKPVKTVWVVLRSNHSQTIDLSFKAQLRNMRSSSPHTRCRLHTAPPDLSIVRPPSTRPVRPSLILYNRSSTPATILVVARHAAPVTCTPWDKQVRFSKQNKGKRKTKQNCIGFEFKPHQVNNSSQSNQGTNHLVSQASSMLTPINYVGR